MSESPNCVLRRGRIAYLLKRFPRLSETFVLNEILELRRQGMDVMVYALMDPAEGRAHPEALALSPEVVYLHSPNRRVRSWWRLVDGSARQAASRPRNALRVAWTLLSAYRSSISFRHAIEGLWLAQDLSRRGVTHLHAHFAHSPAAVAHFARLGGGPAFSFTAHAKDLFTTEPADLRRQARAAEFVVTCTGYNARYLRTVLERDITTPLHVAHHGVDLDLFNPAERRPQPGLVLSVGRLVPKKGLPVLLAAIGMLLDAGISCRLEVYGGGPEKEALRLQARSGGYESRVILRGARVHPEIVAAYREAAVFALTPVVNADGDRDGIPNVLIEAMASGVPVVSSAVSGIPELITDGVDGFLVPPGDPEALAAALKRLLGDPSLARRIGEAGRRTAEARFGLRESVARLRWLFASAHGNEAGEVRPA